MIDVEKLPQVCIGYYYRDCKNMFNSYIEEYYEKIAYVNKYYPHMIKLHSGNEIYFMTDRTYEDWCRGRTYRYYNDDRVYHSGYLFQPNANETFV